MSCEERQDQVFLYAAGALDPAEREEVRKCLEGGCAICAGSLAEAQAMLAGLSLALDPQVPPGSAKAALMDRVRRDAAEADAAPAPIPISRALAGNGSPSTAARPAARTPWAIYVVPSALAAMVAVALTLAVLYPELASRQRLSAGANAPQGTVPYSPLTDPVALQRMIGEQAERIQILQAQLDQAARPDTLVRVASLTSKDRPDAQGRVVWNVPARQWYFMAGGLPALPAGKSYELWYIKKDAKPMPAGMFDLDPAGVAFHQTANLPPAAADAAVTIAVTDEPSGGVAQPTGTVRLAGELETPRL